MAQQSTLKLKNYVALFRRAGAAPEEINSIVQQITDELYDGIKTQEIYRLAFSLLRRSQAPIAARYSLRRALLGLGPTSFRLRSSWLSCLQLKVMKLKQELSSKENVLRMKLI